MSVAIYSNVAMLRYRDVYIETASRLHSTRPPTYKMHFHGAARFTTRGRLEYNRVINVDKGH